MFFNSDCVWGRYLTELLMNGNKTESGLDVRERIFWSELNLERYDVTLIDQKNFKVKKKIKK